MYCSVCWTWQILQIQCKADDKWVTSHLSLIFWLIVRLLLLPKYSLRRTSGKLYLSLFGAFHRHSRHVSGWRKTPFSINLISLSSKRFTFCMATLRDWWRFFICLSFSAEQAYLVWLLTLVWWSWLLDLRDRCQRGQTQTCTVRHVDCDVLCKRISSFPLSCQSVLPFFLFDTLL